MTTPSNHLNPVWRAEHMTAVAALRRTLECAALEHARLHTALGAATAELSGCEFAALMSELGHEELGPLVDRLRSGVQ